MKPIAPRRPPTLHETCPHLPATDRLTDLVIDMQFQRKAIRESQFQRLARLSAELHYRAFRGELPTERRPSRIWDAPPAPKQPWYGRDEALFPLPVVTPKRYRVGGLTVR